MNYFLQKYLLEIKYWQILQPGSSETIKGMVITQKTNVSEGDTKEIRSKIKFSDSKEMKIAKCKYLF